MLLFAFCFGLIPAWECGRYAFRLYERRRMYALAEARAGEVRKPLLVIGDPDGGWSHKTHGYGDVCLDMTGCPNAPVGIKCELGKESIPLADNSHVVFVCYTLELVPDIEAAYADILRVAGAVQNLFVLSLNGKRELAAFAYPGVEWVVETSGVGQVKDISKYYRRLPFRRRFR